MIGFEHATYMASVAAEIVVFVVVPPLWLERVLRLDAVRVPATLMEYVLRFIRRIVWWIIVWEVDPTRTTWRLILIITISAVPRHNFVSQCVRSSVVINKPITVAFAWIF